MSNDDVTAEGSQREPSPDQLQHAVAALERGGVAFLPTDTIYGLHALATNAGGVEKIVDLKGRGEEKPFVVIGASLEQLETLGVDFRRDVRELLTSIWPAPLTAVLPLRKPVAAARGAATLAVRVPALPWLRALLERTGPLASTSANRSGEAPVSSPENLAPSLHRGVDSLVSLGLYVGEPSAIVDFTSDEPRVIRDTRNFFTQNLWKTQRKSL